MDDRTQIKRFKALLECESDRGKHLRGAEKAKVTAEFQMTLLGEGASCIIDGTEHRIEFDDFAGYMHKTRPVEDKKS